MDLSAKHRKQQGESTVWRDKVTCSEKMATVSPAHCFPLALTSPVEVGEMQSGMGGIQSTIVLWHKGCGSHSKVSMSELTWGVTL